MFRGLIIGCLLAVLATPSALAQRLERMVVTSNTIDAENMRQAPAVFRRVQADFIQVGLGCQSGSRDLSERRSELETVFGRVKGAAKTGSGFTLSGGDIGFSASPIDTVLFGDIFSDFGTNGNFNLILAIDTREGETFDQAMARAKGFVEGIDMAGRTECFLGDAQFLGISNANAYRDALLKDIQTEIATLRGLFAPAILTITGLEGRIVTQPSGPLELEIFVPYTLTVEVGRNDRPS